MGDGQVHTLAIIAGNLAYKEGIGDYGGVLVAVSSVFISCLLAHNQQKVGVDNTAKVNSLIANNSLSLGGAAAGFRAIGLGLNSQLVI